MHIGATQFNWTWIKRALWASALLYVVMGTFVWQTLYGAFLVAFAPELPRSKFRESNWCRAGDWVIDVFQPMVGDNALLKHLAQNKEEMLELASMVIDRSYVSNVSGLTSEFKTKILNAHMDDVGPGSAWPAEPYSVERVRKLELCLNEHKELEARRSECLTERGTQVIFRPSFGRTWGQYFCTENRSTTKGYIYFPGVAPRIVNGDLLGPVNLEGKSSSFGKVVTTADKNEHGGRILKQIDAHWFIYRF